MGRGATALAVNDLLGSACAFVSALDDVIGGRLLPTANGCHVTLAQLKLLKCVTLLPDHTIRDLARFLGVSNAAASKAADRLVRRKLLDRVEGQRDRRAVNLSLTVRGQRLLAAYENAKKSYFLHIFRGLSPSEFRQISALLDRLSLLILRKHHDGELCLRCGLFPRRECMLREITGENCIYAPHRLKALAAHRAVLADARGGGRRVAARHHAVRTPPQDLETLHARLPEDLTFPTGHAEGSSETTLERSKP